MNMLLLVGTVLGVGALALGTIIALFMAAPLRAMVLGAIAAGWAALYGLGLIGTSLASHEVLLPAGQTKYFCGFYFDCHVGVAVLADSVVDRIAEHRAAGTYHVLTLRFSSTAVREALTPWRIRMFLEDSTGMRYERDREVEQSLTPVIVEHEIPPGGSYVIRVVFDVPAAAMAPRLFVEQGPAFKIPEALLIGDEASVLHRKTMLALPG